MAKGRKRKDSAGENVEYERSASTNSITGDM